MGSNFRTDPIEEGAMSRAQQITSAAGILRHQIEQLPDSAERAQALARLKETEMWALQGV